MESDEVFEFPIFEVSVDHDDQEVNLICDQGAEDPRPSTQALSLGDLLGQLEDLLGRCRAYSVYSGSAFVSIDDEYEARYDAPLVGVARNRQEKIYGFLQFPPEQWGATS